MQNINQKVVTEPSIQRQAKPMEKRVKENVSKIEKMAYTESKKSDKQALDGRRIFKQLNGKYKGVESRNETPKPKRTPEQIKENEKARTVKMFNGRSPAMFPELFQANRR